MSCSTEKEKEDKPIVAKTAVDLQRLKLMKLMSNPEKPVMLPERPKTKNTPSVPEFVRNVMGSSAGAGSGEFHVYRHLRRKEYARQKFIQEKGRKELLDEEYHRKLEENKKMAEEVTAKRRAKRLKKKQRQKQQKKMKPSNSQERLPQEEDSTSEEDDSVNEESKVESSDNTETDNSYVVEHNDNSRECVDDTLSETNNESNDTTVRNKTETQVEKDSENKRNEINT